MHSGGTHILNPRVRGMRCLKCGAEYPVGDYFFGCPSCLEQGENSAVTFLYNGAATIDTSKKGWARYAAMLPYEDTVTLGEGNTPVLSLPKLAEDVGVAAVYTKNEFQNPTGSHKDRMNPFIVARAAAAGYATVTCASSGNEAASLAAYAAAEGLKCVNVSTESIPAHWKLASDQCGAELVLVPTSPDRLRYQREHMDGKWYPATNLLDVPTASSAWGIQGYKTLAYELFDEFGVALPDCIMIPTCRGDLLYGVYEGFADLRRYGYITALPKLVACEPIPRLEVILSGEATHKDTFPGQSSRASSIGGATATWQSEVALRETKGFAVSVPDHEAVEDVAEMGRYGLYLETSSAIVYGCLKKAVREGFIRENDSVLLVLTSNGYKNAVGLFE